MRIEQLSLMRPMGLVGAIFLNRNGVNEAYLVDDKITVIRFADHWSFKNHSNSTGLVARRKRKKIIRRITKNEK